MGYMPFHEREARALGRERISRLEQSEHEKYQKDNAQKSIINALRLLRESSEQGRTNLPYVEVLKRHKLPLLFGHNKKLKEYENSGFVPAERYFGVERGQNGRYPRPWSADDNLLTIYYEVTGVTRGFVHEYTIREYFTDIPAKDRGYTPDYMDVYRQKLITVDGRIWHRFRRSAYSTNIYGVEGLWQSPGSVDRGDGLRFPGLLETINKHIPSDAHLSSNSGNSDS